MKLKIVGIDASLSSTGVAVLNDPPGDIYTEAIKSNKTGPVRLIEIRDRVREICAGADLVVIEGYAFAQASQAHQLGELGGVLRTMLHEIGVRVLEVGPGQLKKFASGKGNTKKEQMALAIYKRWDREFATNDEADAFVLVQIGRVYLPGVSVYCDEGKGKLTVYQQEVIDALRGVQSVGKKKSAKKIVGSGAGDKAGSKAQGKTGSKTRSKAGDVKVKAKGKVVDR